MVAGEALVDLLVRTDGSVAAAAGGGPYNTALTIARLGVPVAWLGGLSSDRFGRLLEAGLEADAVALDLVQRTDLPTTLALAELDAQGAATYRFYVNGTSAPRVLADGLPATLPPATRALHVGTLGLVLEPMATTLESLVAGLPADVLLMVDPNCRPSAITDPGAWRARLARILARADVVKVSAEDAAFLVPGAPPADAVTWMRALGTRVVLLTDGSRPVSIRGGGPVRTVPVPPVPVVDTVGAGDTLAGAVLACLVHDGVTRATLDLDVAERATRFGVRAAAVTCSRAGANPPSLDELGGWPAPAD